MIVHKFCPLLHVNTYHTKIHYKFAKLFVQIVLNISWIICIIIILIYWLILLSGRRRIIQVKSNVLMPVVNDVKKHIWLMIFLDLLQKCIIICLLIFIIQSYLRLLCLLKLLYHLRWMFQLLLLEHCCTTANVFAEYSVLLYNNICFTSSGLRIRT